MKILMVNKFYYIKGGSETYYFELKRLLESKGHTVIDFSMTDEKNFVSPYSSYFVNKVDYNTDLNFMKKIKASCNIIYSFESIAKIKKIIKETQPDIVHLHIFQHQISPSILGAIYKTGIPIVYTAHDLKMLCLNYKMLNQNGICEKCKGYKYYNCVKYKCVKNSILKSLVCMIEGYLHFFLKSYQKITKIITPSIFYHDKFIEFGIKPEKVEYIPNFLKMKPTIPNMENVGSYYLYFGRLSDEKGIITLVQAFEDIKAQLIIVGTGPLEDHIKTVIREKKYSNVEMLGFKQGEELKNLIWNAKAVILPSEWYENSPYSAIEALSMGKVILGANIGGIPELIDVYSSGLVFKSGDSQSLATAVMLLESFQNEEIITMQHRAYEMYITKFTEIEHFNHLEKVYMEVLKS